MSEVITHDLDPVLESELGELSDMIRELRRREDSVRLQEISIASFLAQKLDATVQWPCRYHPHRTNQVIARALIAPLNGDVFNEPLLDSLCREKRPDDWRRFNANCGLRDLLLAKEICRVEGGYQRVHATDQCAAS